MVPVDRTETLRLDVLLPVRLRESRPETERREEAEREEREEREERDAREDEDELLPFPPPVIPVGGEDTIPVGETTGASPHVSQYSSPPPMSS